MQTTLTIILIGCILLLFVYQIYRDSRKNQDNGGELFNKLQNLEDRLSRDTNSHRQEVQKQLERMHDKMHDGLSKSHVSMQKQFDSTSKIIQEVTTKLVSLDKTNKQVLDFSSQLQNLQHILKNPKQRGVLGEYWLESLLSNVLPKDAYKMQYHIGNDEKTEQKLIADAIILVREQIIPIDAKFSLENYNRIMQENDPERREKLEKQLKTDIKLRIDETSKYIREDLGTMNFAFMFIPAEGVYYNLMNAEIGSGINSRNLIEYAFSKHVMIVSPTSFYAYLQTVLQGLRELQLEKSTQDIIKRVGELGKHFRSYADYHDRLGKNLSTVVNQYNQTSDELRKMSKDVKKITSGKTVDIIEMDSVDKPKID